MLLAAQHLHVAPAACSGGYCASPGLDSGPDQWCVEQWFDLFLEWPHNCGDDDELILKDASHYAHENGGGGGNRAVVEY